MARKGKGTKIPTEKQLATQQDQTMQFYLVNGVVKDKDEAHKLHQFFSPMRVPEGLTNEEALECLAMYPIREWHRNRWTSQDAFVLSMGRPLPPFHFTGKSITRDEFRSAMSKFKADVAMLLMSDIVGIDTVGDNKTGKTIVGRFVVGMPKFKLTRGQVKQKNHQLVKALR